MGLFTIRIAIILYFCSQKGIAYTLRKEIVGGEDAKENEYTYQVSLMFRNRNICGGAIIGDLFIITAAHCFIDQNGDYIQHILTVLIGSHDYKNINTSAIQIVAESIYVPTEFIPPNYRLGRTQRSSGDIAVVKLRDPIRLEEHPNLMKLEISDDWPLSYENEVAIVTGFGHNIVEIDPITGEKTERGQSFGKMRYAETKVISNHECNGIFYNKVYDSHMCARVKQRSVESPEGVCTGDSGSPLVYGGNKIIGILSSSPDGCEEHIGAGIYTRVSAFSTFVKNAMSEYQAPNMRLGVWFIFDRLEDCNSSPVLVERPPEN